MVMMITLYLISKWTWSPLKDFILNIELNYNRDTPCGIPMLNIVEIVHMGFIVDDYMSNSSEKSRFGPL